MDPKLNRAFSFIDRAALVALALYPLLKYFAATRLALDDATLTSVLAVPFAYISYRLLSMMGGILSSQKQTEHLLSPRTIVDHRADMKRDLDDLVLRRLKTQTASVSIKWLAVTMQDGWAVLEGPDHFLTKCLTKMPPKAEFRVELAVLDLGAATLSQIGAQKKLHLETFHKLISDFAESYKQKMKGSDFKLIVHQYDHMPNWHGLLIDNDVLYLSHCRWSSTKEFLVGENAYQRCSPGDARFELFNSWFDHCVSESARNKKTLVYPQPKSLHRSPHGQISNARPGAGSQRGKKGQVAAE